MFYHIIFTAGLLFVMAGQIYKRKYLANPKVWLRSRQTSYPFVQSLQEPLIPEDLVH